ncbi:MAG: Ig-like domain-containing protein [Bacteroidales bacterium]|nr:Ig-like domain-containing protein [Bacteroidales bacterium]
MNKFLSVLWAAACIAALTSCHEKTDPQDEPEKPGVIKVTSVSLDREEASVHLGNTLTLTATVRPDNATDKTVTWGSSNTSVATVDGGVVTPHKEGFTIITAKAGDRVASCEVTVLSPSVPVGSITLNKNELELELEQTFTLIATILPENADVRTATWSSSAPAVASVVDGVVSALTVGNAVITASADGKKAECRVTVKPKFYAPESVSLDRQYASLSVGETLTLTATVYPDYASDKTVTWTSSDPNVATVSDGVVQAAAKGIAYIIVETTYGAKKDSCKVTVGGNTSDGVIEDLTEGEIEIED